jgi:SAM-dependent methyltransferase
LKLVELLQPKSILDVGCGNGRYGFLFREILEWNYGRIPPGTWEARIDGIEISPSYLTPIHAYVYSSVHTCDWMKFQAFNYDLVFMGDVLEHFGEGDWQRALMKAKQGSKFTIVVCPNWRGSIAQEAWGGNEYERHRVELSPGLVGGKCLFANSKMFLCLFDNGGVGTLDRRDILL